MCPETSRIHPGCFYCATSPPDLRSPPEWDYFKAFWSSISPADICAKSFFLQSSEDTKSTFAENSRLHNLLNNLLLNILLNIKDHRSPSSCKSRRSNMQRSHGIISKPGRLTETYLVFRIFKNCKISENCISLKALKNLKPAGEEEPQSSAISDIKARSTVHKLTVPFMLSSTFRKVQTFIPIQH